MQGAPTLPAPTASQKYDYIIVGAGAAGCVLANRLTEDSSKRVLLLEAGGSDASFYMHVPIGFPYLLGSSKDWAYVTEPEAELENRRLYFPRGKVLGGSHSISVMLYHRGTEIDYNSNWPAGWKADDVLPYFLKSERQTSREKREESEVHGKSGPLTVSDLACVNPMSTAFITAAEGTGIGRNDDFNDWRRDQAGAGQFQVTQKDGVRVNPNNAYLEPVRRRRNLTVLTGVHVEKVLFDNSGGDAPRAAGVRFVDDESRRQTFMVEGDGEVILSGGVYASPQLLMLSGIGPAEELAKHSIPVIAESAAVGSNLQDHAAVMLSYESQHPIKDKAKHQEYYTEKTGNSIRSVLNYLFRGKGPLTSPMCEAGAFVKTDPAYESCDLQLRFLPFVSEPDPYESLAEYARGGVFTRNKSDRKAGFTLQSVTARPRSRGTVTLASGDARDRVRIAANWMTDPEDVKTLTEGLRISRAIAAQQPFAKYRGSELCPGADKTTVEDLHKYVRRTCHTANAMVGTCRMGDDEASVVDAELKVRGVQGLRVVDSSVMPTLPGGQSGAPSMMIAERCADLIKGKSKVPT